MEIMTFDDLSARANKLYYQGSVAADYYLKDLHQRVNSAYGNLSRQITVLKTTVADSATNAYEKDYGPRTMVLLFAIPIIGSVFYTLKEFDYYSKHIQAQEDGDWTRLAEVIHLKNEMIKSHMTATVVKTALFIAMGAFFAPLAFVYTATITFQLLRLSDNQEALERFNRTRAPGQLALAF